jgi:hypothetical protein
MPCFNMPCRKQTGFCVSFLVLACCLPVQSAEARLNLPRLRQTIKLTEAAASAVSEYTAHPSAANELPASLQNLLLNSLPTSFQGACEALMETWGGPSALGTSYWQVRLLDRRDSRVWLVFRCGSRQQEMADSYDERLALLRIENATLEFLPLGPDVENDSDLYRVAFRERLTLHGAQGTAFILSIRDNPGCGGPESRSQDRMIVLADTPRGLVESLNLVTRRDDSSHSDDPEVDTETTYRAKIEFEPDTNGRVIAVTSTFREEIKDITWDGGKASSRIVDQPSGALHYRWNPATLKFEEVK